MFVHSAQTRRKRIHYYKYAPKEAMDVKVIPIAREKMLRQNRLNFEVRVGEFFIKNSPVFLPGGGGEYPLKYFQ